MSGLVHRAPDRRDVARDAGRRLVVDDGDGFDRLAAVSRQLLPDDGRIDAVPPVAGNEIDLQAEPHGHVAPERGELAGLDHQHRVAGRQRVDERRLPRAGAGRGIDHDRARGLKHALKALDRLAPERRERGAAMIDRRLRDGPQDPIGHVGRAGDLEEVTSAFHAQQLITKATTKTRRHEDARRRRNHRDTETQRRQEEVRRDGLSAAEISGPEADEHDLGPNRGSCFAHASALPAASRRPPNRPSRFCGVRSLRVSVVQTASQSTAECRITP